MEMPRLLQASKGARSATIGATRNPNSGDFAYAHKVVYYRRPETCWL
jgi:hypothetical protein